VIPARRASLSSRRLAVPLAIAAAAVGFGVLYEVGGSSDDSKPAAAVPPPTVEVRQTKLGRILVDARGHSLYLFLEDTRTRSACYGGCARVWPPLLVAGRPKAGRGVDAAKLTIRPRKNSKLHHVAYNGHLLYTTDADERPGQTEGQGFFNTWFVVSPKGRQIGKPSKNGGGY
jgi:predicted lipoprotein with Yx(FWY)xxD motif